MFFLLFYYVSDAYAYLTFDMAIIRESVIYINDFMPTLFILYMCMYIAPSLILHGFYTRRFLHGLYISQDVYLFYAFLNCVFYCFVYMSVFVDNDEIILFNLYNIKTYTETRISLSGDNVVVKWSPSYIWSSRTLNTFRNGLSKLNSPSNFLSSSLKAWW